MRSRILTALLGLTLLVSAHLPQVFAGEPVSVNNSDAPILLVTAASAERLLGDMDFIFETAERKEYSPIARGFIALMGDLRGIDRTKPFGLMLLVDPGIAPDPVFIGFVPVTDIAELTKTLQLHRIILEQKQGKENRYVLSAPDRKYQVVEQQGYLFLARNEKSLDRQFPDPVALTKPLCDKYDIGAVTLIRNAPHDMKEMLIDLFRAGTEWAHDKRRYESKDQHKIRTLQNQLLLSLAESLLRDGDTLTLGWNLSRKKKQASLEIDLETRPGSDLARRLKQLGQLQGRFENSTKETPALSASSTLQLTNTENDLLEESLNQNIQALFDKETLPQSYRTELETLFQSLHPTIQKGRLDSALRLEGEKFGQYRLTGGITLARDTEVRNALIRFFEKLKTDGYAARLELNAVKHQNVSLHRIAWEAERTILRSLFGSRVAIYFGTGSDAFWMTMTAEENALPAIKQLIDAGKPSTQTAKQGGSKLVSLTTSISRWLPLISGDDSNQLWKAANAAFSQGGDSFTLNLRGTDRNVALRLRFEEGFIRFAGRWMVQQFEAAR